jgi:hypothetical protein
MNVLAACVLALAALPAVLFLWNLMYYLPARRNYLPCGLPVSILIPARNEERSIEASVRAALATQSAHVEVVVANDHSEDRTAEIVNSLSAEDSRVRLISVPALPDGWCGKQFACQRLSESARYQILCFLDADVRLAPQGVASMVETLRANNAALLSGFPRQETHTWLEQMLLPLMHFLLLVFLPMRGMKKTNKVVYGAGCGQIFVADANAYCQAGGHAAIRGSLHDGITLPRAFRRAGLKSDLCDATAVATCRMYRSSDEVVQGLLKNATEGLASSGRIIPFSFLLMTGQVAPVALLAYLLWHAPNSCAMFLAAAAVTFSYLPRLVAVCKFQQPILGALFHPLAVVILLGIQWYAFVLARVGEPNSWKGRTYSTN